MEIVVLGVDPIFASPGDSGGFLAVEEVDRTRRAAGMAIGKNCLNDLVCYPAPNHHCGFRAEV